MMSASDGDSTKGEAQRGPSAMELETAAAAGTDIELEKAAVTREAVVEPPGEDECPEVWQAAFPLTMLPPLLPRDSGYWGEMFFGVAVVVGFSSGLIAVVFHCSSDCSALTQALLRLPVLASALVAGLSTLFILFSPAGEIRRSERTCYPIPAEVAACLRDGRPFQGYQNLQWRGGGGSFGAPDSLRRTYCVRCHVWRNEMGHHCRTCQRCYTEFDHHCGVYGRCIRGGNMKCFNLNLAMLLAGVVLAGFSLCIKASGGAGQVDSLSYSGFELVKPEQQHSSPPLLHGIHHGMLESMPRNATDLTTYIVQA